VIWLLLASTLIMFVGLLGVLGTLARTVSDLQSAEIAAAEVTASARLAANHRHSTDR